MLAAITLWGQSFQAHDLAIVALLVVLEAALSVDNALVLGLLARRVPPQLQKRALTYGLVGAFVFRLLAVSMAAFLLKWHWAKAVGGLYLLWVAFRYFVFEDKSKSHDETQPNGNSPAGAAHAGKPIKPSKSEMWQFWTTVLSIELTDIAFAVDSIVAAIGMIDTKNDDGVGAYDKLWIVLVGGFIGVMLMRVAAVFFIKLLKKFPHFELAAYLLVTLIGAKLMVDWWFNPPSALEHKLDFHSPHNAAFWIFWGLMIACFCVGFLKPRAGKISEQPTT